MQHVARCPVPAHIQMLTLCLHVSLPLSLCSMEENRRYLAALKRLLELPGNRTCADCASVDAG